MKNITAWLIVIAIFAAFIGGIEYLTKDNNHSEQVCSMYGLDKECK